jgi:hypothetical protein
VVLASLDFRRKIICETPCKRSAPQERVKSNKRRERETSNGQFIKGEEKKKKFWNSEGISSLITLQNS